MACAWTGDGVVYSSSLRTCFMGAASAIASNVAVMYFQCLQAPVFEDRQRVDEYGVNLLQSLIVEDRKSATNVSGRLAAEFRRRGSSSSWEL